MYKKYGIIVVLLMVGALFAESFLITEEKTERRVPAHHLRNDIIELMGDLVECESALTELKAQFQQKLCKHIRAAAENQKDTFLKKRTLPELHKLKKMLQQEKQRCAQDIEAHKKLIALIAPQNI